MNQLPPGWTMARIEDIIRLNPRNDCADNAEVGFVPLNLMGIRYRDRHGFERRRWSEVKRGYTHFIEGDVLLARITPSFENGKAGIARNLPNGIGAGSTEYFVCRPIREGLVPEYLLAYFKADRFLQEGEKVMSGAVGQQRVPKQYVLNSELPLAPFNEQKRIVDKLDTLMARVDLCRDRLDGVPKILQCFRQSVLSCAVTGRLTEDWRDVRKRDCASWNSTTLGKLVSRIDAGLNIRCEERPPEPHERGLVKISAVTWGRYNDVESKTLPASRKVPESTRIRIGDFLLSRANTLELVGACVIVDRVTRPVFLSDKVLRLVMPPECKRWMLYWLRSDQGRKQIERLASGNQLSMRNISQANLKSIALQLPPEDEREEIVRRVELLFQHADHIAAWCGTARDHVDRLSPAILETAFQGKLVPQDPEDEPASALLERIRAHKSVYAVPEPVGRHTIPEATPKRARAGGTMLSRKEIKPEHLSAILKEQGSLTAEDLWSASQLEIDDFYEQLRDEEAAGLLREVRGERPDTPRRLEVA